MSRFKALIVDFGGVLTTPLQDSMVRFAEESGIELQDLVRAALGAYSGHDDSLVVGFETGAVPEREFSLAFAKRLTEATGVEIPSDGLVARIFGSLDLEEDMLGAVQRARAAGFKTGLLSNSWGVDHYPHDRLMPLFDDIVISGEVGLRKPDPEIFELAVQRLRVAGDDCVFVDDHPGHLKVAQDQGMTTVLHRSPATTIPELTQLLDLSD